MENSIDYQFLSSVEGGSRTNGYVPVAGKSKSGVTIATGFDLGQRNENDLKKLNLDLILISKLSLYLGVKGIEAQRLIKKKPLVINISQAKKIDKAVKKSHIDQLIMKYNAASPHMFFSKLPPQAQTVIASLSFQYGVNLNISAPNFWYSVIIQDWSSATKELQDFGDIYPTRRNKEAKLLEEIK